MADFRKSIDRVLGLEGGYVNDPRDPGGETKWGISKRSYPSVNIKALTREQAIALYKRDFWDKFDGDKLSQLKAYQLLDCAVNHGIVQAIRFMQRAVDVADDGVLGPKTRGALFLMNDSDFALCFLAERLEFYTKLSTWSTYSKGWSRRIASDMRYAAQDN